MRSKKGLWPQIWIYSMKLPFSMGLAD